MLIYSADDSDDNELPLFAGLGFSARSATDHLKAAPRAKPPSRTARRSLSLALRRVATAGKENVPPGCSLQANDGSNSQLPPAPRDRQNRESAADAEPQSLHNRVNF